VIRALETHADTNVLQNLSLKSSLSYLETLLDISKRMYKNGNPTIVLPFALKNNMLEYRINMALKYKYNNKRKKISLYNFIPLVLSLSFLLFSFKYTFESYNVSAKKVSGTFTIQPDDEVFAYAPPYDIKAGDYSPLSDIIEWRYKTSNKKLYKRQYNCTKDRWIGSWELIS
jgi:hypothetical protein